DTEDLRLARAGVTLRRRRGGHDAGWHLKLPVGGDSRDEVRVGDARAVRRRTPPAELVGLVRALTRGARLAPVAELATARRRWRLRWSMTTSRRTRWAPRPRACPGVRSRWSWAAAVMWSCSSGWSGGCWR